MRLPLWHALLALVLIASGSASVVPAKEIERLFTIPYDPRP